MGRRKKEQSPVKTICTASEINKLKSKAKRMRFLQITLEIKTSRKVQRVGQGAGEVRSSILEEGARRAEPGGAPAADRTWREARPQPGCEGCLKIPPLIIFINIFIFYFWTDS